jgi:hypothetical protein
VLEASRSRRCSSSATRWPTWHGGGTHGAGSERTGPRPVRGTPSAAPPERGRERGRVTGLDGPGCRSARVQARVGGSRPLVSVAAGIGGRTRNGIAARRDALPEAGGAVVGPFGRILDFDAATVLLAGEELPRSGAEVTRRYRRPHRNPWKPAPFVPFWTTPSSRC